MKTKIEVHTLPCVLFKDLIKFQTT